LQEIDSSNRINFHQEIALGIIDKLLFGLQRLRQHLHGNRRRLQAPKAWFSAMTAMATRGRSAGAQPMERRCA